MEKEVVVKYDNGTEVYFTYKRSEGVHCPNCAQQEVWCDKADGDYYEGPTLICGNCDFLFTMPTTGRSDEIAKQLREVSK